MKKNLLLAIAFLFAMCYNIDLAICQSTSSGLAFPNTPAPGGANYLGWQFGTNLPLNINNQDA